MSTNTLMACGIPVPVMVDPVMGTRVFLFRWSEWCALSFCMTFLVAGVDPATGIKSGYMVAASQSISTMCGLIFPFCKSFETWLVFMTISFILWFGIFVALYRLRKNFAKIEKGKSAHSIELWDRARLAYKLMMTCCLAWSALVVAYFLAGAAAYYRPEGVPDSSLPIFQRECFNMLWEAIMDVILKNLYLDIVVQVHKAVFDDSERAERRLAELRLQMTAIWVSSSDTICVSVQGVGGSITTMVSPVYLRDFHGITNPKAIAFEVHEKHIRQNNFSRLQVRIVDEISFPELPISDSKIFQKWESDYFGLDALDLELDESSLTSLARMVWRAWNHKMGTNKSMNHRLLKVVDGTKVFTKCEANIRMLDYDSMLVVVRDISERTKLFEAEKKTVLETTARRKDAEANRFTRHEVKNGLLAAIELCESLNESTLARISPPDEHDAGLQRSSSGPFVKKSSEVGDNSSGNQQSISVYTKEIDETLKTILDTVLSEAMARDVIHGNYEPKLERIELEELLRTSDTIHDQFSLQADPSPMPSLHLDPQLLLFIHRNAVSNACKYGKINGRVTTKLRYDEATQLLQMDVLNLPGPEHDRLLKLGANAPAQVFAPGRRLHQKESSHSAGDGAWIMQKCAETLKGRVSIRFDYDMTKFSLVCPAKRFDLSVKSDQFKMPKNTWGVAIDDSKIQRKLLSRFLSLAGVPQSRQVVKGYTAEEIQSFDSFLVDLVEQHPTEYFLVVADENLDIAINGSSKITISGSKCIQRARQRLDPRLEARMLSLIRSANDSAEDIATYLSRAHGFIPKAPVRTSSVVDAIAPLWEQRFNDVTPTVESSLNCAAETDMRSEGPAISDFLSLVVQELQANLDAVDELCSEESIASLKDNWPFVWEKLHCLKGDLSSLFHTASITQAVTDINAMRGSDLPANFETRWAALRSRISDITSKIGDKNVQLDVEAASLGGGQKRSISESSCPSDTPTSKKPRYM
ncbi:MAG: hypothetical protein SGBAC_005759 [Bacillariaceae sp.]